MVQFRADRRAGAGVPNPRRLVRGRGDHALAGGVERRGQDVVIMLQRWHQKTVRDGCPHQFTPGRRLSGVRVECQRVRQPCQRGLRRLKAAPFVIVDLCDLSLCSGGLFGGLRCRRHGSVFLIAGVNSKPCGGDCENHGG